MKSLFTRLTENIGDSLAKNVNKNLLIQEKLKLDKHIDDPHLTDFNIGEIIDVLKKENPTLLKNLDDFVQNSRGLKEIAKKKKEKKSKSTSSRSSSRSSSSGSSCGSSTNWGSSCGSSRSSRSYSSGGCYSSGRSSGGC